MRDRNHRRIAETFETELRLRLGPAVGARPTSVPTKFGVSKEPKIL